jgi:hypothetical protein
VRPVQLETTHFVLYIGNYYPKGDPMTKFSLSLLLALISLSCATSTGPQPSLPTALTRYNLDAPDFTMGPGSFPSPRASFEIWSEDDRFTFDEQIRCSLYLSDVPPEQWPPLVEKSRQILRHLQSEIQNQEITIPLPDYVNQYLHQELFIGGYESNQNDMAQTLKQGTFNCTTSANLFAIFAQALGFEVVSVYAPEHVFCSVKTGEEWIDVETTTRYGFNPDVTKTYPQPEGRGNILVQPSRRSYAYRDQRGFRDLMMTLKRNNLTEEQTEKLRIPALQDAVDYFHFTKSDQEYRLLAAAFYHHLEAMNDQGQVLEAAQLLQDFLSRYEYHPKFLNSVQLVARAYLILKKDAGEYAQAEVFLDELWAKSYLDEEFYRSFKGSLYTAWFQSLKDDLDFLSAYAFLEEKLDQGQLTEENYTSLLLNAFIWAGRKLETVTEIQDLRELYQRDWIILQNHPRGEEIQNWLRDKSIITQLQGIVAQYNSGSRSDAREGLRGLNDQYPDHAEVISLVEQIGI